MKAQTKAILASLVVIAVALSAVSGVTYSWWSDSENTDITVGTGNLDVEVSNIQYSKEPGSSGFFTIKDVEDPEYDDGLNGEDAKLRLITALSNVAPNDVYYIDYFVQYSSTVLAKYITVVEKTAEWIDVEIGMCPDTLVGDDIGIPTQDFVDMEWSNLPSDNTIPNGSTYVANKYVRVTITIADDAPMNAESTIQIINEITQKANEVGGAVVTAQDNVVTGTTTGVATPIKATFTLNDGDVGPYTFKYSASKVSVGDDSADDFNDGLSFEFTLEDSDGNPADFKSVVIEAIMPGTITNPVVVCNGEEIDGVSVMDNTVTFETDHFSEYTILDTVIDVGDGAELSDALKVIKSHSGLWNRPVTVNLAGVEYGGSYGIYQYPEWNGKVGAGGSGNNLSAINGTENVSHLKFVGADGAVFTGDVRVYGWGNSGNAFSKAMATTVFNNVGFDATDSADNEEDYIVMYMKAAANNVTFEDCTFSNATHITAGGSGSDGVGKLSFKDCVFNNGGAISGYYETLYVTNTYVKEADNVIVDKKKAGPATISGCDVHCGKYAFRTGNSGVEITVIDCDIEVYESDGEANLVKFRNGPHSATFTDCTSNTMVYDGNGELVFNGVSVVNTNAGFASAVAKGYTQFHLLDGEYNAPSAAKGKTLTITGMGPDTIIEVVGAGQGETNGQLDYNLDSSTVTFNKLAIITNDNTYAGYARLTGTYNDCTFINTYCLGGVSKFNNCTFNLTSNNYLWTYGAPEVTFENCTFNTEGKAILIYSEAGSLDQTVNIKDCIFNASKKNATGGNGWCAAVEIDSRFASGYTVNFSGNNVVDDDFNGLYRLKNSKTVINVSVTIGGVSQNVEVSPDSENQL